MSNTAPKGKARYCMSYWHRSLKIGYILLGLAGLIQLISSKGSLHNYIWSLNQKLYYLYLMKKYRYSLYIMSHFTPSFSIVSIYDKNCALSRKMHEHLMVYQHLGTYLFK
jgi:hypothetical protein